MVLSKEFVGWTKLFTHQKGFLDHTFVFFTPTTLFYFFQWRCLACFVFLCRDPQRDNAISKLSCLVLTVAFFSATAQCLFQCRKINGTETCRQRSVNDAPIQRETDKADWLGHRSRNNASMWHFTCFFSFPCGVPSGVCFLCGVPTGVSTDIPSCAPCSVPIDVPCVVLSCVRENDLAQKRLFFCS